jgi:hypothetical protein
MTDDRFRTRESLSRSVPTGGPVVATTRPSDPEWSSHWRSEGDDDRGVEVDSTPD